MGKGVVIVGTSSSSGKTFVTALLLYHLRKRGYRVAPFKVQNMSLNSYPAFDGGEIAIAQAMQAYIAGVEPSSSMNPILLKPIGNKYVEVIVCGKPTGIYTFKEYWDHIRPWAWRKALKCFDELMQEYDIVVVEGAGSVAEPNFLDRDIANLRIAIERNLPAILVADIERGGAFASIIGSLEILPCPMKNKIRGFIINKFRGSLDILEPALKWLKDKTGIPILGVIPYINNARIWPEDSLNLEAFGYGDVDVALIAYPTATNLNDLEPLRYEDISLKIIRSRKSLGDPDIIILPGARSTIDAMMWMKQIELDKAIKQAIGRSVIIGLCGGHELLGKRIIDKYGLESGAPVHVETLGVQDYITIMYKEKIIAHTKVKPMIRDIESTLTGYEIHRGRTIYGSSKPLGKVIERNMKPAIDLDGSINEVQGVYTTFLHDILWNDAFRCYILDRALGSIRGKKAKCKRGLDKINILLLEMDKIYRATINTLNFEYIEKLLLSM